jgi:hypothetical protein
MLSGLLAAALIAPWPVPALADYQLGGAYPTSADVVVRDWRTRPQPGTYSVCYINGFQAQPEMRKWWLRKHPRLLLEVRDRQWDERLLDTRRPEALARVVGRWIDDCARKGFDAVEPDNLDSWTRSLGLLSRADNVRYAKRLIARAHAAGLAIAQKNTASLAPRRLFDFAVVEECQRYRECGRYRAAYGNAVLQIEYRRADFRRACRLRSGEVPVVLRDRLLRAPGTPAYRFAAC